MKIVPNRRAAAPKTLVTYSVAVEAMHENGTPATLNFSSWREPSEAELASDDFLIGNMVDGRAQYVCAEGEEPWGQ